MTALFDTDTVARLSQRTGEPQWVAERRQAAYERFSALPWPDQTLEEWKHTDLRKLYLAAFDPFPPVNEPVGRDVRTGGVR